MNNFRRRALQALLGDGVYALYENGGIILFEGTGNNIEEYVTDAGYCVGVLVVSGDAAFVLYPRGGLQSNKLNLESYAGSQYVRIDIVEGSGSNATTFTVNQQCGLGTKDQWEIINDKLTDINHCLNRISVAEPGISVYSSASGYGYFTSTSVGGDNADRYYVCYPGVGFGNKLQYENGELWPIATWDRSWVGKYLR